MIVRDEPSDDPKTNFRDELGPAKWRPPEFRLGGLDRCHSGSDIYLLAGIIYEALTGGEWIVETETADGVFAHEHPDFTIERCTQDPRVPEVNKLLRSMFRRNPELRLGARAVVAACNDLLTAKFRGKEAFINDKIWKSELEQIAREGERRFNLFNGDAASGHLTRQVREVPDAKREARLKKQYLGSSWHALRPLVIFRADAARYFQEVSYVFIGRIGPDEMVVVVQHDDGSHQEERFRGTANSTELKEALVKVTAAELERLENVVARRMGEELGND